MEIAKEIPENLPQINSDELRVNQIRQNIIGNAVKFTEKDKVTVSAGRDEDKIYIRVRDTGNGVSENNLHISLMNSNMNPFWEGKSR